MLSDIHDTRLRTKRSRARVQWRRETVCVMVMHASIIRLCCRIGRGLSGSAYMPYVALIGPNGYAPLNTSLVAVIVRTSEEETRRRR
jgi:hypothetical protein